MDVILLEKVANLGALGEKVKVKSGYGRNFLVPYGKAVSATEANVKAFEARRAELEKAAAAQLADAQARVEQLAEGRFTISSKAGDEGRLFGSIGVRDVAEAITAAGFAISKGEVRMPNGPLRQVGEYMVQLQLHSDIATDVTIVVVAE